MFEMRIAKNASPARTGLRILLGTGLLIIPYAQAQESPTPMSSPEATAVASPTLAAPTPTITPARSVRISFVPPPLEGTISLGIYDTNGNLVRVLHQQASLDVFSIRADALETKWDGKDDNGLDMPPGKYHARGYVVGALRTETMSDHAAPMTITVDRIPVRLVANPLVKNDRPNIQLAVGFDDTDSFLKTIDGLPLYVISEHTGIANVAFTKNTEKSIDVWQSAGAAPEHLRISNVDQMMAFDCGSFDLK